MKIMKGSLLLIFLFIFYFLFCQSYSTPTLTLTLRLFPYFLAGHGNRNSHLNLNHSHLFEKVGIQTPHLPSSMLEIWPLGQNPNGSHFYWWKGKKIDTSYWLQCTITSSVAVLSFMIKLHDTKLWYMRLDHISITRMEELSKRGLLCS